jgi:hypothetical protein
LARIRLLAQVHAVSVGMLCGDSTLILNSCSVRSKCGGDLTGLNPTDQGKRRWLVGRSNTWVHENKLLALWYDRLTFIIQSLLQATYILLVAEHVAG